MIKDKKIIIIGGGASGLISAIIAARKGYKVLILEYNDKPAKKIAATGNGKCNLSNLLMDESYFRSENMDFVKNSLEIFNTKDTCKFFEELGILIKNKDNYLYPNSLQAVSISQALLNECFNLLVEIRTNIKINKVYKKEDIFFVKTDIEVYKSDILIVATGSKAGIAENKLPALSGYEIAESFNHKISPVLPALTGIKLENKSFYKYTQGVRAEGLIKVFVNNKEVSKDLGEIQFTEYGLSGIPVFQISRYASIGIYNNEKIKVHCDFLPCLSEDEIFFRIKNHYLINSKLNICDYFTGIINQKLLDGILFKAGIKKELKGKNIREEDLKKIIYTIKNFEDNVKGINSYNQSQICTGGVILEEINDTMESKLVKNLYITGELLDVDGMCGGYNLQWAWTTGYIAANSI